MPRYKRYFHNGQVVFLTLVTHARRPWLKPEQNKTQLLVCLRETKARYPFRHIGHVILDDHLHLLLAPDYASGIPEIVSSFKRNVFHARRRQGTPARKLWQPRFYDHVIRSIDDLERHLDYIHYNPVKHGYVRRSREYRWSSLSAWAEQGMYEPDWGAVEPETVRGMELD